MTQNYMQVLDHFREEYEKETSEKYNQLRSRVIETYVSSWSYVCWLESKLDKYEPFHSKIKMEVTSVSSEYTIYNQYEDKENKEGEQNE